MHVDTAAHRSPPEHEVHSKQSGMHRHTCCAQEVLLILMFCFTEVQLTNNALDVVKYHPKSCMYNILCLGSKALGGQRHDVLLHAFAA